MKQEGTKETADNLTVTIDNPTTGTFSVVLDNRSVILRPTLPTEADSESNEASDIVLSPNKKVQCHLCPSSFELEKAPDLFWPTGGEILIGVDYEPSENLVSLLIKSCRNLPAVDRVNKTCSPYVKTFIQPESAQAKRRTTFKSHTINPDFNERLRYSVLEEFLPNRKVLVEVWHRRGVFGCRVFLGQVILDLKHVIAFRRRAHWYQLTPRPYWALTEDKLADFNSELLLSLKFEQDENRNEDGLKTGRLTVNVIEAFNLLPMKSNNQSDTFCKVSLLPIRSVSSKQKTPVVKWSCNPRWVHTMYFNGILVDQLSERCLELSVWDFDYWSNSEFMGGIRLNTGLGISNSKPNVLIDSTKPEAELWNAMLNNHGAIVTGRMPLRCRMDPLKGRRPIPEETLSEDINKHLFANN